MNTLARPALLAGLLLAMLAGSAWAAGDTDAGYADAMSAEHAGDSPVPAAAGGEPVAGVTGEAVTYDGHTGYVARPAGDARGALIVIHEWWGLNDNIREMARRLAAEGYLALAVDLYGGATASDPGEARSLMSRAMADPDAARSNLRAAHDWVSAQTGGAPVGSIGWCFGGGWSLQTALMLPETLDAAVIYYGRLVTDRDALAALEMPVLGIFGGQDQGIPVESVRAFEATLEELGKDAEIVVYPGADHAFANPSGTRYDPDAARDAWQRTLEFLDAKLAGG